MYIGVNDDAEIEGVARQLYRSHGREGNQSFDLLRTNYADQLRRFVNEGITPAPQFEVEWLEHAGLYVLRVSVLRSDKGRIASLKTASFGHAGVARANGAWPKSSSAGSGRHRHRRSLRTLH